MRRGLCGSSAAHGTSFLAFVLALFAADRRRVWVWPSEYARPGLVSTAVDLCMCECVGRPGGGGGGGGGCLSSQINT